MTLSKHQIAVVEEDQKTYRLIVDENMEADEIDRACYFAKIAKDEDEYNKFCRLNHLKLDEGKQHYVWVDINQNA